MMLSGATNHNSCVVQFRWSRAVSGIALCPLRVDSDPEAARGSMSAVHTVRHSTKLSSNRQCPDLISNERTCFPEDQDITLPSSLT